MADNVTIDPGTTPSIPISTDDAGASGHVQRVKLALSADGSAAHATVDADGVLVNLGANNDVTVAGVATAANQATLIGHVDTLETLIAATNTALATLDGRVDGLETLIAATNAVLATIDTDTGGIALSVDGLETLSTAANALLSTIDGRVDGVEALLTTLNGLVDGIETLIGTTNSTLSTIDGRVDGVEALLTTIDADTSALAAALRAEDSVAANADVGLPVLAVRRDSASASAADGDYLPLSTDSTGQLRVAGSFSPGTTTHRLSPYETLATPLDSELDGVTNGNLTAASSAIDNTTTRHRHCAFTVTLGAQTARTAGAHVVIYRNDALDGSNYDSVDVAAPVLAVIPLPTGTAAGQWTRVVRNCLPPGLFKVFVGNQSTQTTAASANLLEIRMFSDEMG